MANSEASHSAAVGEVQNSNGTRISSDNNPTNPTPTSVVADVPRTLPKISIICSNPNGFQQNHSQNSSTNGQDICSSAETTIRELEANESSISGVLRYCKQRILSPYLKLLGIIGLKPICNDIADLCTCSIVLNKVYVVLITMLLLTGYILQYLTCFRRDRGIAYKDPVIANHKHTTDISPGTFEDGCKGNPIYVHLFPSILHFGSFIYVVYLYRLNHDEQLPNLLERVFIHAAQTHSTHFSQKRLVRSLQILVFLSISWVFLSLASQIAHLSLHTVNILHWRSISTMWKYGVVSVMTISNFWQDTIQVAVIGSYCVHCSLLATYLTLIESRIQHHSLTLTECIKEIGEVGKLIHYLNSHLGPALGPLILLDSIYSISSIAYILDKGYSLPYVDLINVGINGILWLLLLWFPLYKGARLATSCHQLRELGHFVRMRPFGYQSTPQVDLDSFLLFISTLHMNVHILRIPVTSAFLSFCIGAITFGLLTWGLFFV